MVNMAAVSAVIGNLYKDKVSSTRRVDTVNSETGVTEVSEPTVVLTDEPCYLSVVSKDDSTEQGAVGLTKNDILMLFMVPTADVVKGDWVSVTKTTPAGKEVMYKGRLGVPQIYDTHIQVTFTEVGVA